MRTAIIKTAIALGALCLGSGTAAACRISLPHTWDSKEAIWIGPCENGVIGGSGVLTYKASKSVMIFYGAFKDGWFVRGAVEGESRGSGIKSLNSTDGIIIYEAERSDRIKSLQIGADAAFKVGEMLAKQGDAKGAEHYKAKGREMIEKAFLFFVP